MDTRRKLAPPPATPFVRIHGTKDENRIQQHVADATEKSRSLPQVKGRKKTVTLPATGQIRVAHGLGRRPEGYNQQSATGASPNYHEVSRDSRFITFESAAACTVELWIF